MPWKIEMDNPECSGHAVVKQGSNKVVGCHKTHKEAEAQLAALYAAEPGAAVKSLSDQQLIKAHGNLHLVEGELEGSDIAAHHYLAQELRERGLEHPVSDSEVHKAVVEMSTVRVSVANLSKRLSAKEIETVVDMAVRNGTTYANVHEMLTADGWVLSASPAQSMEEESETEEYGWDLTSRQSEMMEYNEEIVERFGMFDHSDGPEGAHYMPGAQNPFRAKGVKCVNCVAFKGGGRCCWVEGEIDPEGVCKLWIIPAEYVTVQSPKKMASSSPSSNKDTLSETQVDVEKGDPTSSSVHVDGTDLYGGGKKKRQMTTKEDSLIPPQNVRDTAQRAVEWIKEGKNGDGFTSVGRVRASQLAGGNPVSMETLQRMQNYFTRHEKDKQADGFNSDSDKYPSPGRVAWDAWGGDAGKSWANRSIGSNVAEKSLVYKSVDEMRFTLGPWYVPNTADAHNEWTDQLELQKSLWEYVRKGNRAIRLQHAPETKAGEWVEAMTMPFDMEVPMLEPDTGVVTKKVFPEGTVFLGVIWEPWAWEMVKKGEIRGYSIGGSAERHEIDVPSIIVDVG